MFGHFTYLLWLILYIAFPLFMLFRWRKAIRGYRRTLGWTVIGALIGGWLWDAAAVHYQVWYYDPNHILGLWFLGLPLEEWLWIAGVTLMFGGVTIVAAKRIGVVA